MSPHKRTNMIRVSRTTWKIDWRVVTVAFVAFVAISITNPRSVECSGYSTLVRTGMVERHKTPVKCCIRSVIVMVTIDVDPVALLNSLCAASSGTLDSSLGITTSLDNFLMLYLNLVQTFKF